MAIETRTIVFNEIELVQAAYNYCVRVEMVLPHGRLNSVRAGTEAMDRVVLSFVGHGAAETEIQITYHQMAAALILHCGVSGIPLPRYARKRLAPAGEGMAMIIRMPEYAGEAFLADAG